MTEPLIHPGVYVEDVDELSFAGQLKNRDFLAILVLLVTSAIIFIANVVSNMGIVNYENQQWYGLSIGWFIVMALIVALLVSHMVYKPYKLDKRNGGHYVFWALIYFVIAQVLWAVACFHSQPEGGTVGLLGFILLAATVWLGWCCYNLDKSTIYIFILVLLWTFYLQAYAHDVNVHGWKTVKLRTL